MKIMLKNFKNDIRYIKFKKDFKHIFNKFYFIPLLLSFIIDLILIIFHIINLSIFFIIFIVLYIVFTIIFWFFNNKSETNSHGGDE